MMLQCSVHGLGFPVLFSADHKIENHTEFMRTAIEFDVEPLFSAYLSPAFMKTHNLEGNKFTLPEEDENWPLWLAEIKGRCSKCFRERLPYRLKDLEQP